MAILRREGLRPQHRLLDIGCGSLRLGCKAVPYLDPGHYWGTDLSAALMGRGYDRELTDQSRLPRAQLVEDPDFTFAGLPADIDYAIAFAVFTHLPATHLARALIRIRTRFPGLDRLLFTVFLAAEGAESQRQPDGVVTHADRAPYHLPPGEVARLAAAAGFALTRLPDRLPRGQVLHRAIPHPIRP
jgi:SAM-dependent methyltransferase